MMKKIVPQGKFKRFFFFLIIFIIIVIVIFEIFAYRKKPDDIKYGVSFNIPYAIELGLDWKEAYIATLDDLEVKRIRLSAQWPLVEAEKNQYNFSYLDFQLDEAKKRDVDVILAIGRRVPRWPECHIPKWAAEMPDDVWQSETTELITKIVNRYKDYENIIYWQVENEPFLEVFAYEHCGPLDKDYLDKEIDLVKELDPETPILMTDSGNLGMWSNAYSRGDSFGTSVYLYFWNPYVGQFRSILTPSFYRAKANLMELLHGKKETFLIELSLEPWLIQPLIKTPVETQLEMMDLPRMKKVVKYAEKIRFENQYLWGVEWWYWLKVKKNMPEMWEYGRELLKN